MNNTIIIELEFNSIPIEKVVDTLRTIIPFTPTYYSSLTLAEMGNTFTEKVWQDIIDKNTPDFDIHDFDINEDISEYSVGYSNYGHNQSRQSIYFYVPNILFFDADFVNTFIAIKGLKYAYIWDAKDAIAQSKDNVKGYGRRVSLNQIMWHAASHMWFGEEYYKYVPKSRLLAFPYAEEVVELPNNVVFIKLFNYDESPALPKNREKQRLFREWVKMDAIENELRKMPRDRVEIITFFGFDA